MATRGFPLSLWENSLIGALFAACASDLSSEGRRLPRRPAGLVGRDVLLVRQRDADVVESFEEPPPGVVVDLEGSGEGTGLDGPLAQVDDDLGGRLVLD